MRFYRREGLRQVEIDGDTYSQIFREIPMMERKREHRGYVFTCVFNAVRHDDDSAAWQLVLHAPNPVGYFFWNFSNAEQALKAFHELWAILCPRISQGLVWQTELLQNLPYSEKEDLAFVAR